MDGALNFSTKTLDEHFELFCLVLERGFVIHTGGTNRLLTEFALQDSGKERYLPRIESRPGISFQIPEQWLKPSKYYLYYDPTTSSDIPQLAEFKPEFNDFVRLLDDSLIDQFEDRNALPVVKLSTLRGLHYIKNVACLQLYDLDFDLLRSKDDVLSEHLRGMLLQKLQRFLEFSRPWLRAVRHEMIAEQYLKSKGP